MCKELYYIRAISIHVRQVDGVELEKEGLDLYEFAEVLIDFGVWQAAVSIR